MTSDKVLYKLDHPHGPGSVFISWRPGNSTHLATTGCDGVVSIYDRQGEIQERIQLMGLCSEFGWDVDGDILAVITNNSSTIILWDATTNKKSQIDAGVRDTLTCMMWAKHACILAVGTQKGNLILYDHSNARRIPILGKHKKKIVCGAWSSEGILGLAGEDRILTISTADGDTRREIQLQGDPQDLKFGEMKTDSRTSGENTISLIIGKVTLLLYNIRDPDNPIELAFQKRYGPIVTYKWYGDGYILVGFEAGYLISISTHIKEVGQELLQIKNHRDSLNDISLSLTAKKIATCGDNTLKIHGLQNIEETEKIITISGEAAVNSVEWSADGTMIAAVTHSGNVLIYLAQIPKLTSVCGNRIALLASLTEVIVYLYTLDGDKPEPQTIHTIIEPSILSVGPTHVAVAVNNRALFWNLSAGQTDRAIHIERDYLSSVESICLNETYTSVLYDGKIQLHTIKTDPALIKEEKDNKVFANPSSSNGRITCHALSAEFLVYGTDMGRIVYFCLDVFNHSTEYSHISGIKNIFMDVTGTNMCFIDDKNDIFVYNPVDERIVTVPDCPDSPEGVIWDQNIYERSIFAIYNKSFISTYIFIKYNIEGSKVVKITTTKLPSETLPLLMYGGEVTLGVAGGKLLQITLSSHENVGNIVENKKIIEILDNQINCHRYRQAWNTCLTLNDKNHWIKLGKSALENLDIEMGIRAYREIPDVSMVWALQKLENIEELSLLYGHICLLLENYNKAEKFFLESSEPVEALYLRRDLMEWEQALTLAQKFKPDEIPFISQEYAQQLELTGNYPKALINYERALSAVNENTMTTEQFYNHRMQCLSGIARTSIRCGDSRRGVAIAMENDTPRSVRKECAEILENMKQFTEAAMLYEKADYYDKAALAYIKLKNWVKVGQLLPQISAPKINIQYAKAKEAEGKYDDAARAYEIAKDYDNIIRINLEYLNNPGRSVEIVQQTKSIEGAKMVARYFQKMNDYNSAIKFLIMSNCHDEAFQLANQHGKMELYGDILVNTLDDDNVRLEDFKSLAIHFETQKNSLLAGKYYFYAKDFHKALKHLLKAAQLSTDDDAALSLAIDTIAVSKDDKLANQLIDFLLGGDGLPKDPKYLFRLYMARKQYKDAAKTAIIIANEEQVNGNYRNAHDVLFGMYQELKRNKITIPLEMNNNLRLLHSYILVRLHVKRNDHLRGARMLIRVANNISKFPSHIVPILTSTVIECHRAGLKYAAFNYAAMLMRPEYRTQVNIKYSKKIEAIVRKPPRSKDHEVEDEPLTPCPYCKNRIPETEITCDKCKNTIPFCIATGRHIIENDFTACPQCDFPAIKSEFLRIIETDELCPMCNEKVDLRMIPQNINIRIYLEMQDEQFNQIH
ncbi:Similar to Wdr19: WD repeat-containing protein 19 (Mus musculus) [Cotesia congregata]|uniref:Similar to Wdr19: WD repeat-containing protein 19 (Mus musculus) n=1 Tax=Cotesia congregata TaxID=51543 RepID=A0A8J2HMB3_COTCN|nr:Similar to Wdr19: WD repeat-containing protein 19 (Mus musculus) [Cotesia congregata]